MVQSSLYTYVLLNYPRKNTDSWIWKFILSLRPLAKVQICCKIRDGELASLWYDNWSERGPLIDLVVVDGPLLMGLLAQSTIAQACCINGWRVPWSRFRNTTLISHYSPQSSAKNRVPNYYERFK